MNKSNLKEILNKNEIKNENIEEEKKESNLLFNKMIINQNNHNRNHSKIIDIITKNGIIAEYTIDTLKNQNIIFYKLPPKILDDDETPCDDDDDNNYIKNNNKDNTDNHISNLSNNKNNFNNNNNGVNIGKKSFYHKKVVKKNSDKFKFKKDLFFPIDYEIVYNGISEFYYPLLKNINSTEIIGNNYQNIISRLENYIKSNSVFEPLINDNYSDPYIEFLLKQKENEEILLNIFIFLIQNILNLNFDCMDSLTNEQIEIIFKEVNILIKKIYESLMLINLYNYNLKKETKNKNKTNTISFENLCMNYFKEYYKNIFSPSNEQIIIKLNDCLKYFMEKLLFLTETITTILNQLKSKDINIISSEYISQKNIFEKILSIYKEKEKENVKEILITNISILKYLINTIKIQIPYLPKISNKYKYTLVVDLDETLVHYVEEEERAFVQVRPYADYFLKEMGKYFEIVIFTAAAEDYADIVLQELDKFNSISYKLYRKHTNLLNGIFFKDLSKLGRDIQKICIIDNNKENYGLQPDNGLHISSFLGDQSDNELLNLSQDLMKIIHSNLDDIRPVIKVINNIMKDRYIRTNAHLE